MRKITLTLIGVIIALTSITQSKLDSLISLRKTDVIEGKLLTYYTPGHRDIALEFQKIITDAINYYESKYSKQFQVKLIVLDSAQWLNEMVPYGFVFYNSDWLVMNTGMNYESFKKVYGAQSYYQQLDKELRKKRISELEMINSVFKAYGIHELGHYFINKLSNAKSPDRWTNEFIATYFSYEFFKNNKPKELKPFELFCSIDRDYYLPKYSTIKDFNDKYSGTGLENYLWYHSNFYFLAKALYTCNGKDFITMYESEFPKNPFSKLQTDEIITKLDKNCSGLVGQWVKELESKTKK
jgi:hypothetical protein